jgi:hypothetical protein
VLTVPECSDGTFTGVVTADAGTAAKGLHYTIDGGPELFAQANSATGDVTVAGVPPGAHTIEYWGEDQAGQLERVHHLVSVLVGKRRPKVKVRSDRGEIVQRPALLGCKVHRRHR